MKIIKLNNGIPRRAKFNGIAAVEFAIVLPLLILLALPVIDIARAIQANLILMSLSREGANLAARGQYSLKEESQNIMRALISTTPPLDMNTRGMIYITRIMGRKIGGAVSNVVIEQYRWNNSSFVPPSQVWNCGGWAADGSCSNVPEPPVSMMAGALAEGEVINVVESFYNFNAMFSGLIPGWGQGAGINSGLRAMAVF